MNIILLKLVASHPSRKTISVEELYLLERACAKEMGYLSSSFLKYPPCPTRPINKLVMDDTDEEVWVIFEMACR
jgi:hypothetical protein